MIPDAVNKGDIFEDLDRRMMRWSVPGTGSSSCAPSSRRSEMDPTTLSSSHPEYPKIETLFKRGPDHKVLEGQLRCPEFALVNDWRVTEKVDGTNIRVSLEPDPAFGETDKLSSFGWKVRFYGRTSRAQIPTFLLEYLQDTFTLEKMQNLWRGRNNCEKCGGTGQFDSGEPKPLTVNYPGHRDYQCDCVVPYPITFYGEGYGARIQKGGGNYRPDSVSFRLFDVFIGDKWLNLDAVKDIADRAGILAVPEFLHLDEITKQIAEGRRSRGGTATILDAIVLLVKGGFNSSVAQTDRPELDWDKTCIPGEGIVARTDPYLYDWRGRPLRFKLKSKDFA